MAAPNKRGAASKPNPRIPQEYFPYANEEERVRAYGVRLEPLRTALSAFNAKQPPMDFSAVMASYKKLKHGKQTQTQRSTTSQQPDGTNVLATAGAANDPVLVAENPDGAFLSIVTVNSSTVLQMETGLNSSPTQTKKKKEGGGGSGTQQQGLCEMADSGSSGTSGKTNSSLQPKPMEEGMNDGTYKLADFVPEFEALAWRQSLDFRVENDVFVLRLSSEMGDQWFSRLLMIRDEHSTIRLAEFTGCPEEFNEKVEHWLKEDYGPNQLMEALNIKCVEYFQQS